MGTPIFNTQWDLCGKTSCPIKPGELDIEYTQTLPPIAPPVRLCALSVACQDTQERFAMLSTVLCFRSCAAPLFLSRATNRSSLNGLHGESGRPMPVPEYDTHQRSAYMFSSVLIQQPAADDAAPSGSPHAPPMYRWRPPPPW